MILSALKRILPERIFSAIEKLNFDSVYELRMRCNRQVSVGFGGRYFYLCDEGLSTEKTRAIKVTYDDIENTVMRIADHSIYAVNDQLIECYVSAYGIRVGVAGEVVCDENGKTLTVKNFSSLVVRIPHEVIGCGERVARALTDGRILNALIISKPGAGKTTLLRDVTRLLSSSNEIHNVLVVDERGEIASSVGGVNTLDVGVNCDVITGCSKEFAFSRAVRALKPDVIVTDELVSSADSAAVEYAVACGVSVIASVHALSHTELQSKTFLENLLKSKCIDRYVDVYGEPTPGVIGGIYDKNFKAVIW